MPITDDEIVALYLRRRQTRGRMISKMEEIRRHYNGEIIVPLPELDEVEAPAIVNLIYSGIDDYGRRVSSVLPNVVCESLRPGYDDWDKRADDRRSAVLGWWSMNRMQLRLRRRARFMAAYGQSPLYISPVPLSPIDKRNFPRWIVRNPLSCFPAPQEDVDEIEPPDCITAVTHPYSWLLGTWPEVARSIANHNQNRDAPIELLHYNDCDETVLLAYSGADQSSTNLYIPGEAGRSNGKAGRIATIPNRAGIPLTVVPGRISLDRIQGMFDQLPGMHWRAAKLDALEAIAAQRAVMAEQWAVSHPQSATGVRIVKHADAREGIVGEIEGGTIQTIQLPNSVLTSQALDRLERGQRVTAGLPAEWGGESGSNIRTAKRGDSVMAATVDMPIQEDQDILAASLEAENVRAIAVERAYYGSTPTSFYIPRKGMKPRPDYTPDVTFETDWNVVKYSIPGTDQNGMVISMAQRVGTGEMSIQTMQEMDPVIEDPTLERNRVATEALRKAYLAGLEQQQSQNPNPLQVARIAQILRDNPNMEIEDAAVEEAKQQQAAAPPPAALPPGPGGPPQLGPGGQSPIGPGLAPGTQSLDQLLGGLTAGGTVPGPERAPAAVGQ